MASGSAGGRAGSVGRYTAARGRRLVASRTMSRSNRTRGVRNMSAPSAWFY